MRAGRARAGAD